MLPSSAGTSRSPSATCGLPCSSAMSTDACVVAACWIWLSWCACSARSASARRAFSSILAASSRRLASMSSYAARRSERSVCACVSAAAACAVACVRTCCSACAIWSARSCAARSCSAACCLNASSSAASALLAMPPPLPTSVHATPASRSACIRPDGEEPVYTLTFLPTTRAANASSGDSSMYPELRAGTPASICRTIRMRSLCLFAGSLMQRAPTITMLRRSRSSLTSTPSSPSLALSSSMDTIACRPFWSRQAFSR